MKIGVDIDGVTADFVTAFLPVLGGLAGREVRYEEITSYWFQEVLGYDDATEVWVRETIDRLGVLRRLAPIPGALETVNRLGETHEVHFVTARPEAKWGDLTREWLSRHGFRFASVMFREGRKAGADEGFGLFVEDSLENARDLSGLGIHVCLFDQPWNRTEELPEGVSRVGSWAEVAAAVEEQAGRTDQPSTPYRSR